MTAQVRPRPGPHLVQPIGDPAHARLGTASGHEHAAAVVHAPSGVRSPSSPSGRKTRMRIRIPNTPSESSRSRGPR